MIAIEDLAREFYYRHEFGSEEISVLHNNHPGIMFHNIPEAWLVVIDQMLDELRSFAQVTWVQQHFGFLTVLFKDPPGEDAKAIVKNAERRLYRIDMDLHKQLDCRVVS
jgi:hypothetical protein